MCSSPRRSHDVSSPLPQPVKRGGLRRNAAGGVSARDTRRRVSSHRSDARPASLPSGVSEEHMQEVGVVVDRPTGGLPQPGRRGTGARDRARPAGSHNQPPDETGVVQGDVLHDVAAQGPAQQVGKIEAECADELSDPAGASEANREKTAQAVTAPAAAM
jgi:hypothetical protein